MADQVTLLERRPTAAEYQRLRAAVGWPEVERAAVERGLAGDLFSLCAIRDGQVIGCARVVGDAGIYLYVQDVIVLPEHQGHGVGKRLLDGVMAYVEATAGRNTFVGLMAAQGVVALYERYGFAARPADRPGMYRLWP